MAQKKETSNEVDVSYLEQLSGEGLENISTSDLTVPFLQVLQQLSPELNENKAEYNPNAKAGMVINTASGQLFDTKKEPIRFIPCSFVKLFVEWRPRSTGGGIVKSHSDPSILLQCHKNDKGQDELPNGNTIATTSYHFGIIVNGDSTEKVIIPMTSTQLKNSRKWLTLITTVKLNGPSGPFTPPMFAYEYLLKTVSEENTKGSWSGWHIELGQQVKDAALFNLARNAYETTKDLGRLLGSAEIPKPDALPF